MRKFLSIPAALAAAGCLVFSAAQAQTTSTTLTKERISADYKAAKAACDNLAGNAKDICVEEAKGKEKVAKAELEYSRTGKVEDMNKVMLAKAEAAYEVAKERCDDKAGNEKDVCMKEAKAAEVRAKADAKVSKESAELNKDAAADKREAEYKVASEKCESMAGEARAACVDAAKARFGKS